MPKQPDKSKAKDPELKLKEINDDSKLRGTKEKKVIKEKDVRTDADHKEAAVANGWVNVEKKEKRLPSATTSPKVSVAVEPSLELEGGIPAKVAVQVDGQLSETELLCFLSRFGNVKGTKDCIKEGGTFVFFSSISAQSLEKLLGKHVIQGKRAIVFPQDKYKTLVCKNWENFNQCPRGDLCDFAHGANELRAAPAETTIAAHECGSSEPASAAKQVQTSIECTAPPPEAPPHAVNADGPAPKNAAKQPKSQAPESGLLPTKPPSQQSTAKPNATQPKVQPISDAEMDFLAKFGLLSSSLPAAEKKKPKKHAEKDLKAIDAPGHGNGANDAAAADKRFSLFYY